MLILATFQGGVIINLNNIELSVALLYVHAVQSFADGFASLFSEIDNPWWHLIGRHALHIAIDNMAIDGSLDLEGLGGDDVSAGVEQLSVYGAHSPVEPALDVLLNYDPIRELKESLGDLQEFIYG